MIRGEIRVLNQLGLHARAAAQVVRLAERFKSDQRLIRQDENISANARSILSILTLAASSGVTLILEAEGEDEQEAFDAMRELFEGGFGEP